MAEHTSLSTVTQVNRASRPTVHPDVLAQPPGGKPLRLSYLIARLDRVIYQRLVACVKPHGVNVPHYTALSILGRRNGLSNAQLARRSYVSPQGMNQVLDELIRLGLVTRRQSRTHGRVLHVQLTARGRRVLAACDTAVDQMERDMLQDIRADELRQLMNSLLACVHALHGGLESIKDLEL